MRKRIAAFLAASVILAGMFFVPAGANHAGTFYPHGGTSTHYVDEWYGQGQWVYNFKFNRYVTPNQGPNAVFYTVNVHRYHPNGTYMQHSLHIWMREWACPTLEYTPYGWAVFIRTHQFSSRQICAPPIAQYHPTLVDEVDIPDDHLWGYNYDPGTGQHTLTAIEGGMAYGTDTVLERVLYPDPIFRFAS